MQAVSIAGDCLGLSRSRKEFAALCALGPMVSAGDAVPNLAKVSVADDPAVVLGAQVLTARYSGWTVLLDSMLRLQTFAWTPSDSQISAPELKLNVHLVLSEYWREEPALTAESCGGPAPLDLESPLVMSASVPSEPRILALNLEECQLGHLSCRRKRNWRS